MFYLRVASRFATIKEAFSFINDLAKPKRVSVKPAAKTKSSHKKKAAAVHQSEDGSSDGDEQEEEEGGSEEDDDDLWCTHCLDDDGIIMCGFCGCKVCKVIFLSALC